MTWCRSESLPLPRRQTNVCFRPIMSAVPPGASIISADADGLLVTRCMDRPCVARSIFGVGNGLASMYPASVWSFLAPGHHGYQRAFALISRKASTGHSGHQISNAPADGCSILQSISQTSVGFSCCCSSSKSRYQGRLLSDLGLVMALTGEHAPGDAGQLVGQRHRQDVAVHAPGRRLEPGAEAMLGPVLGPQ